MKDYDEIENEFCDEFEDEFDEYMCGYEQFIGEICLELKKTMAECDLGDNKAVHRAKKELQEIVRTSRQTIKKLTENKERIEKSIEILKSFVNTVKDYN